jgi:hypothetical protein
MSPWSSGLPNGAGLFVTCLKLDLMVKSSATNKTLDGVHRSRDTTALNCAEVEPPDAALICQVRCGERNECTSSVLDLARPATLCSLSEGHLLWFAACVAGRNELIVATYSFLEIK